MEAGGVLPGEYFERLFEKTLWYILWANWENTCQFAQGVILWKKKHESSFTTHLKFASKIPGPFIKSSFLSCSEHIQLHTHWVFLIYSKETHFAQFFNKLSKESLSRWVVKLWPNYWVNCERTLRFFPKDYTLGKLMGVCLIYPAIKFSICPWDTSKSFFRKCSQLTPWVFGDIIIKKLSKKLSNYPKGNTLPATRVRWGRDEWKGLGAIWGTLYSRRANTDYIQSRWWHRWCHLGWKQRGKESNGIILLSGMWILDQIFLFSLIIFHPLSLSTSIYFANSSLSLWYFLILFFMDQTDETKKAIPFKDKSGTTSTVIVKWHSSSRLLVVTLSTFSSIPTQKTQ